MAFTFFKDEDSTLQFHKAILNGDVARVRDFLKRSPNVRKPPKDKVEKDLLDFVQRLLTESKTPEQQQKFRDIIGLIREQRFGGSLAVVPKPSASPKSNG